MTLKEIIEELDLALLTHPGDFSGIEPESGYASDLLSCVMVGAGKGGLWVTLQAHANVVAVGALLELGAIIITEGMLPDQDVIDKANQEGVVLLATREPTFAIVGKLWSLGIRDEQ